MEVESAYVANFEKDNSRMVWIMVILLAVVLVVIGARMASLYRVA